MADGFDAMIDDALTFFRGLEANNTRDWFEPRKADYTDRIRKPAELFAGIMAEDLGRLSGTSLTPKVFRIYRDVRFSKDKTPYNAHLHISWFPPGDEARPGWFFGAAPGYLFLGCGAPGLQGADLTRLRAEIDRDGAALEAALDAAANSVGARLSDYGPPPLKRVPKPFAPDHPQGDLLKRKGLTVGADLPAAWRERGLVASVRDIAERLEPVRAWLDGALSGARA